MPDGSDRAGLAEGSLWVGEYQDRRIHRGDRTPARYCFVTSVIWMDSELWHGTWEGGESELRRIDPHDGTVLESIDMPEGTGVSGLDSDGERFFCGGGGSGKLRVVRRPRRVA